MRYLPIALLLSFVVPGPLHAEESAAEPSTDLRLTGHSLRQALQSFREQPPEGWDGRQRYAWKVYLKRRASKMDGRLRKLLEDSVWDGTGDNLVIAKSQWTRTISEVASLYTELDAAYRGYSKINVSETHAVRNWDARNKRPSSIVRTHSYAALSLVRRDILAYQHRRLLIPITWIERERHLIVACDRELLSQQQAWAAERKAAHARYKAAADATRAALEAKRVAFQTNMDATRQWMAQMQQAEERRLKTQVNTLSGDARIAAGKLLVEMKNGRVSAERFLGRKASRYGAALRTNWAGYRTKLLGLLQSAPAK